MKEIIIDGVDVAGCTYFQQEDDEYTCGAEECNGAVVGCRACDNCYYKQLKRLEQENAELKAEIKNNKTAYQVELGTYNMECGNLLEENEQLLQTLQEIKAIAKDNIIGCFSDKCDLADEILQKITKAEEE